MLVGDPQTSDMARRRESPAQFYIHKGHNMWTSMILHSGQDCFFFLLSGQDC